MRRARRELEAQDAERNLPKEQKISTSTSIDSLPNTRSIDPLAVHQALRAVEPALGSPYAAAVPSPIAARAPSSDSAQTSIPTPLRTTYPPGLSGTQAQRPPPVRFATAHEIPGPRGSRLSVPPSPTSPPPLPPTHHKRTSSFNPASHWNATPPSPSSQPPPPIGRKSSKRPGRRPQRALSIDTASIYSSASAPLDAHDALISAQPLALPLAEQVPSSAPAWGSMRPIMPLNVRRLSRGRSVVRNTERPIAEEPREKPKPAPFVARKIGLTPLAIPPAAASGRTVSTPARAGSIARG
jgi:hypothetical protein